MNHTVRSRSRLDATTERAQPIRRSSARANMLSSVTLAPLNLLATFPLHFLPHWVQLEPTTAPCPRWPPRSPAVPIKRGKLIPFLSCQNAFQDLYISLYSISCCIHCRTGYCRLPQPRLELAAMLAILRPKCLPIPHLPLPSLLPMSGPALRSSTATANLPCRPWLMLSVRLDAPPLAPSASVSSPHLPGTRACAIFPSPSLRT